MAKKSVESKRSLYERYLLWLYKTTLIVGLFVFILSVPGCAGRRNEIIIASLKERLVESKRKLEVRGEENESLKKEIALFKKFQDIDSDKIMATLEFLKGFLREEIVAADVWVEVIDRGLVIIVSAEKLFSSGTDNLSESGKEFLDKIYDVIKERFGTNYLYIEGHTDNQSLAVFEWKSNWEFSFARALNVVKYFTEKKNINPLLLSASGFGQYRPRADNDTKEGRRLNRRIELVISPQKLKTPSSSNL